MIAPCTVGLVQVSEMAARRKEVDPLGAHELGEPRDVLAAGEEVVAVGEDAQLRISAQRLGDRVQIVLAHELVGGRR